MTPEQLHTVRSALEGLAKSSDEMARAPEATIIELRAKLHACAAWLRCASEYIGASPYKRLTNPLRDPDPARASAAKAIQDTYDTAKVTVGNNPQEPQR
jgi:hypothetical protein